MHNRASQSTSSLIVTSLLPVQAGEREPKEKKTSEQETDGGVKVTSFFSSYLQLRCVTGQQACVGARVSL